MVVILAGCDGTGKSTCFNKLKKSMDADFIKESYTKNIAEKTARALFTASITSNDRLTIYDRATLLDDLVYDPVMINQESQLIPSLGVDFISETLNKCMIIYFDLDDFVLTERLQQRGDDYIKAHQINKIKHSYDRVFEKLDINRVYLDTTNLSVDEVYRKVKGFIENEKFKGC